MQTIIQNKLSSMLDELLQKALEEKPKYTNKDEIYNTYSFLWDNIKIIERKCFYPTVKITIPYCSCVDYDNVTIRYTSIYSEKQLELLNKICNKWRNLYENNKKMVK